MFSVSLFTIRVRCWCANDDAFVGGFFDEDESEDKKCACKGEFDVEVQSTSFCQKEQECECGMISLTSKSILLRAYTRRTVVQ